MRLLIGAARSQGTQCLRFTKHVIAHPPTGKRKLSLTILGGPGPPSRSNATKDSFTLTRYCYGRRAAEDRRNSQPWTAALRHVSSLPQLRVNLVVGAAGSRRVRPRLNSVKVFFATNEQGAVADRMRSPASVRPAGYWPLLEFPAGLDHDAQTLFILRCKFGRPHAEATPNNCRQRALASEPCRFERRDSSPSQRRKPGKLVAQAAEATACSGAATDRPHTCVSVTSPQAARANGHDRRMVETSREEDQAMSSKPAADHE